MSIAQNWSGRAISTPLSTRPLPASPAVGSLTLYRAAVWKRAARTAPAGMKPLLSELFLPCSGTHSPFGKPLSVGHNYRWLKGPPVKLTHGLAGPKTTPTAPTAAQLTFFHASGCAAPMATHSMTSSARASRVAGISRPSAFAVLRLITSSNLVACITGRSERFSPLRMRPT
jgi:hypothetical protein